MKEAIEHYEAALKEAFPSGATGDVFHHWNEARKALEQPAQDEPVAYIQPYDLEFLKSYSNQCQAVLYRKPAKTRVAIYTRPQAREPLTGGDERRHIICLCPDCTKPAREPLAWQPSDTAPQDGTKCLVYWGEAYGQPLIGVAARLVSYQGEMLWHGHGGSHNEVTHWMPLPTPPTEAAKNIGEKK